MPDFVNRINLFYLRIGEIGFVVEKLGQRADIDMTVLVKGC